MKPVTDTIRKSGNSKFHLGEYWRILWRKKFLVLLPLLLPVIVTSIGVRFLVPVFASSSVIHFENSKFMAREMEQLVQLQDRRRMHDREALARIESELGTSGFLDQLIIRLGMDTNPDLVRWAQSLHSEKYSGLSAEELIHRRLRGYLVKNIKVENTGPSMFKISCLDFNPETAYALTDGVVNLFIERQQKKEMDGLQDVSDFSDEHLAVYKERLDESEKALDSYKRMVNQRKVEANPIGDHNIRDAETLKKQIDIDVANKQNALGRIRENLVALFGSSPPNEPIWSDGEFGKLKARLIAQRETHLLLQLASTVTPSEDEGRSRRDIVQTERDLQRYLSGLVQNTFYDSFTGYHSLVVEYFYQQSDLESIREKRANLDGYIDYYRRRVTYAPQQERELEKLEDEVRTNRELYRSFVKAKTSTQITESVQNTNIGETIAIIEEASKPTSPVLPNKSKIMMLAFLLGGFLGVITLIVSEYSDTSFRTVEDVEEELGLKVLGTIPRFESSNLMNDAARRKKFLIWAVVSAAVVLIALFGFYYYGKSVEGHKIDLTRSAHLQQ
jgi:succinoglycan biosynthesis transport protein ExoP